MGGCSIFATGLRVNFPNQDISNTGQIAVNQKESMEAVLVGLEQVVIPLVRCAIYEKLYLSSTLSIAVQLKIVLKELYLAILKFLAYAKRYFEKSTTRRFTPQLRYTPACYCAPS